MLPRALDLHGNGCRVSVSRRVPPFFGDAAHDSRDEVGEPIGISAFHVLRAWQLVLLRPSAQPEQQGIGGSCGRGNILVMLLFATLDILESQSCGFAKVQSKLL